MIPSAARSVSIAAAGGLILLMAYGCTDSPAAPSLTPAPMEPTGSPPPPSSAAPGELQACITSEPASLEVLAGQSASFDARCSEGASAEASYAWELGDGRTRTGPRIQTVYSQPGTYRVDLEVRDGGQVSRTSVELRVVESLSACFTFEQVPISLETAPCTMAFSAQCSEGDIREYRWVFGGGPPVEGRFPDREITTAIPEIEYSWGRDNECMYFRPFERTVTLTVVDADGNTSTVEQVVPFFSP